MANARTAASTDFAEDAGGLTRGAKLALVSGFLGWMFDSMDLNVFTLVLLPSIRDLTGAETPAAVFRNVRRDRGEWFFRLIVTSRDGQE